MATFRGNGWVNLAHMEHLGMFFLGNLPSLLWRHPSPARKRQDTIASLPCGRNGTFVFNGCVEPLTIWIYKSSGVTTPFTAEKGALCSWRLEPSHLKNMLLKFDHVPKFQDEHHTYLWNHLDIFWVLFDINSFTFWRSECQSKKCLKLFWSKK